MSRRACARADLHHASGRRPPSETDAFFNGDFEYFQTDCSARFGTFTGSANERTGETKLVDREPDRARATALRRRLLTSPERHAAVLTARARSPRLHSRHHDERLGGTRPVRGRASARRLFSRREARRRRGREARRGAHRPLPDASLHRRPRRRAVVGRSRGGPQSGVRSATPRFRRDPIASDAATAIPDPPPAAKTPRQHFIGGPRQRLSRESVSAARVIRKSENLFFSKKSLSPLLLSSLHLMSL